MSANLNGSVFFYFHLSKLGGKLVFLGNLSKNDAAKLNVKDNFLQELIEIWADFNNRDSLTPNVTLVVVSYGTTH